MDLTVGFIAIRQYLAIHGNVWPTSNLRHSTLAIVEQRNEDPGIYIRTNQLIFIVDIAIVIIFNARVANVTFASPTTQTIGTGKARIEGKLNNAVFTLHKDKVRVPADIVVAITHVAYLDVVGDKDKIAAAQGIGSLGKGDLILKNLFMNT